MLTDAGVYARPTPKAVQPGGVYQDPVFKTPILRVSLPGFATIHNYSIFNSFSCDTTKLLVSSFQEGGGYIDSIVPIDPVKFTMGTPEPADTRIHFGCAQWSFRNPDEIITPITGTAKIARWNVKTKAWTVIVDLSQYGAVFIDRATMSTDEKRFMAVTKDKNYGWLGMIVWDVDRGLMMQRGAGKSQGYYKVVMGHAGKHGSGFRQLLGETAQKTVVIDVENDAILDVDSSHNIGGHADHGSSCWVGTDGDGDLVFRHLKDPVKCTKMLKFTNFPAWKRPFWNGFHVSLRDPKGRFAVASIETVEYKAQPDGTSEQVRIGQGNMPLGPYAREIVCAPMPNAAPAGSPIYRVCHYQSYGDKSKARPTDGGDGGYNYYAIPRATGSSECDTRGIPRAICFTSDWMEQNGVRMDVYVAFPEQSKDKPPAPVADSVVTKGPDLAKAKAQIAELKALLNRADAVQLGELPGKITEVKRRLAEIEASVSSAS